MARRAAQAGGPRDPRHVRQMSHGRNTRPTPIRRFRQDADSARCSVHGGCPAGPGFVRCRRDAGSCSRHQSRTALQRGPPGRPSQDGHVARNRRETPGLGAAAEQAGLLLVAANAPLGFQQTLMPRGASDQATRQRPVGRRDPCTRRGDAGQRAGPDGRAHRPFLARRSVGSAGHTLRTGGHRADRRRSRRRRLRSPALLRAETGRAPPPRRRPHERLLALGGRQRRRGRQRSRRGRRRLEPPLARPRGDGRHGRDGRSVR